MELNVRPYSEKHAIKHVVFALEFQFPLSSAVLEELKASEIHDVLLEGLARFREERGIFVGIGGSNSVDITQPGGELAGLIYDRVKPDGEPEWAVQVNRGLLAIVCGKYERWNPTWEFAQHHLKLLLPLIMKHTKLGVAGLQVVDEFRSLGPKNNFSLSGLFSGSTKFLPSNLTALKGSCHSHHGFFETCEQPTPWKRLHNINIDIVEQSKDFSIQILASHKHFLNDIDGDVEQLLSDDGSLGSVYSALHAMNKNIVGDLLTSQVKEKINFDLILEATK